jgi:hypothetical protein
LYRRTVFVQMVSEYLPLVYWLGSYEDPRLRRINLRRP